MFGWLVNYIKGWYTCEHFCHLGRVRSCMQKKITDFMADTNTNLNVGDCDDGNISPGECETDTDLNVRACVVENLSSTGECGNGDGDNDAKVDPTAAKRSREDSPSGLSPICKRTFSLDGKEVSFEHEPWYVGWLFQSLDVMRSEFQFTADMLSSIESFKVESNSRIASLEAEKADDKRVIEELKTELVKTKEAQGKAEEKIQVLEDALKYHREYTDDHIDQFAKQFEDFRNVFKGHRQIIDEQEQYSSCECILLHGITEKKDENTDQVFVDEINTRLKANITLNDLDRTHRLGKPGGRKGPRPIIAKLLRYNDKDRIFRLKKLLKGTKVMLTERLTRRRSVFLRYAKEKFGTFNVWTKDGDSFVKSEDGIKNLTDDLYKHEQEIIDYYMEGGADPM